MIQPALKPSKFDWWRGLSTRVDFWRAFVLAIAFLMLFLFLDWKPPQHDEGVNGWMLQDLLAKGYYPYDPANYHGPLHFYILFFFRLLFGDNLWALRLSAVIFSMGAVFLITEMKAYLGRFSAYAAALLVAVSPGTVFYSRYAIHESGLFFFSVLGLLGYFRFSRERDKASLWMLGISVTGMIATKETYILTLVCFAAAWLLVKILDRYVPSRDDPVVRSSAGFRRRDVFEVFVYCLLALITLFSGFFLYWKGVFGIFSTFEAWLKTGALPTSEQKGHWKEALYWIHLFLRYEWPAALGLLFCFPLLGEGRRAVRLLMFYGVLLLGVYTMIPYKTPWCILQLIWPFLFVTGCWLGDLAAASPLRKGAAVAVLTLLATASAIRCVALNFFHYADDQEPYAHVQTYESLMSVDQKLKELVRREPVRRHIKIHVIKKAYWPISWLLVDFTHHYYYTEELPSKADAGIIFCDGDRRRRLEMRLQKSYFVEKFRLNPAQDPSYVYYDREIFQGLFGGDAEVFSPPALEAAMPGQGLRASFYRDTLWKGEVVREEIFAYPEFAWDRDEGPLPAPFGVIFSGQIHIPESGEITFFLASDDGSDMTLGDEILINNLGDHSEKTKSVVVKREAGWYPLRIRFYDAGGSASMRFWWKLPSGEDSRIGPSVLKPDSDGAL